MNENKSKILGRRIAAYLGEDIYNKLIEKTIKNRSKHVNTIVADYYKSLSPQEFENLKRLWEEMTPAQRENPRINE